MIVSVTEPDGQCEQHRTFDAPAECRGALTARADMGYTSGTVHAFEQVHFGRRLSCR